MLAALTDLETCPWCGVALAKRGAICRGCLRDPAQHPSVLAAQGGGAGLELDLAPPAPQAVPLVQQAARPAFGEAARPSVFAAREAPPPAQARESGTLELGELDPDVPALELADDAVRPPKSRPGPVSQPTGSDTPSGAGQRPRPAPGRPGGGAAGPAEAAPLGPSVDPSRVRELAGYGPAPTNPLLWPWSAWRVYKRRRELAARLVEQQRAHDELVHDRKSRLADIVDRLRRQNRDELQPILRPLAAPDALVAARRSELTASESRAGVEFGGFDAEAARLGEERARLEEAERAALTHFETCEQEHARADAKHRRHAIELEAAHEAARQAAGQGARFAPPEQARRIQAIEQARGPIEAERAAKAKALAEAREAARAATGALGDLDRRLEQLRARRRAAEAAAAEHRQAALDGLRQAERDRLARYDEALRAIVATHPKLVRGVMRVEIERADADIQASTAELALHREAVGAYDRRTYQRGLALAAVVVVLLLVALGLTVGTRK
ncbi:MAG: hypothetical protein IT373_10555 [Polyangiaceae bacterium]|nr:hypothetical protein [Polyangiaceae bacterium]